MKNRRLQVLLAFYPRAWRRRYGDEFSQLLDDLKADQPRSGVRHAFDVIWNAGPTQLAWRPQAVTPLLVFVVFGAMASVWVAARVSATPQQTAISSLWTPGINPIIVRGAHHTTFSSSYAMRRGSHGATVVRVRGTSRDGHKVIVYCRADNCRVHSRR